MRSMWRWRWERLAAIDEADDGRADADAEGARRKLASAAGCLWGADHFTKSPDFQLTYAPPGATLQLMWYHLHVK